MRTARLLPCLGRDDGLVGAGEEVAKLEGLHEVTVGNKRSKTTIAKYKRGRTDEFQIIERSLIPTSFQVLRTRPSSLTPCSSEDWVLKTAASFCMA